MGGVKHLCAVTIVGLVAVGCGGGEAPPPPPPPPSPGAEAPEPGGPPAKSVTVRMENIQYMPREVRIARGGTVTWKNTDTPPHTVTKKAGPGKEFDSGTLQPDDEFKHTFTERGRVDYICTIHPGQSGTVVVE